MLFYWNFETPCGGPSNVPAPYTKGAKPLSTGSIFSGNSDFCLLELLDDPKDINGFKPYYLGWDRAINPGQGGAGIHHPGGDVKRIAIHSMTPVNSSNNCPNSKFWQVTWDTPSNGLYAT